MLSGWTVGTAGVPITQVPHFSSCAGGGGAEEEDGRAASAAADEEEGAEAVAGGGDNVISGTGSFSSGFTEARRG